MTDRAEVARGAVILARGAVAEWLKAAVLKTAGRKPRGFESLPLRQHVTAALTGFGLAMASSRTRTEGP